jgi:hypothetical protein
VWAGDPPMAMVIDNDEITVEVWPHMIELNGYPAG